MRHRLLQLLAAFVASIALHASATPAVPADTVVSSVTRQVLAGSAALGPVADPAKLKSMVESIVMPSVDFRAMTARAVGPRWRSATDEHKQRLIEGFEALLIKTYAGAFAQAAGATFRMKRTIALDATTAEVHSEVTLRGGRDPIALNYRLAVEDEHWKIVDVSVMGVWLVATYQTQFAQILERTGSLDGLVQALEERARR
ncbi:ABC transporter substrate-binding protein [Piscinibacter sp. XHJ-5]|uniref:MlaC/ttg2D family ABC transporter substrate-binding protein n=1 Tax=Piscinibacter sp. XHJ-5 TaxID=3037797 RepID=UPI00245336BB|nr:ABC transporter substrate-binding protein [Piscinibacter sp. XHJ-5]